MVEKSFSPALVKIQYLFDSQSGHIDIEDNVLITRDLRVILNQNADGPGLKS
jgi:hypothetical protein